MNFSIIGSGNMAHYFGERCLAAGHVVDMIVSRNGRSGQDLAAKLNATFSSNVEHIESTNLLLAIPDNVIREFAMNDFFKSKNIIHTSGSIGMQEIKGMSEHIACLWPVYSIQKNNLPSRNDVPFVMQTSSQKMRNKAIRIVKCLTNNVIEASDAEKASLHLTAVFVNNFVNHLFTIGAGILQEKGLSFEIMLPLIQEASNKLSTFSPSDLQTGPARRGDNSTMNSHLELLKQHPKLQELYRLLSQSIQEQYSSNR